MKKIVFLVVMIILLLTLCSCETMTEIDDKSYDKKKIEKTRFIKIENYGSGSIIVDTDTGVEYWMSQGSYNYGTLTVLVDESGKPKVRKYEQ